MRVLPTLIFYITDFLYGFDLPYPLYPLLDVTIFGSSTSFWLRTRPHVWHIWSMIIVKFGKGFVGRRMRQFSLTCCRQLGQRWLSIVIGQQQQQNFNYYNDKNALIVKQKHCNLCLNFEFPTMFSTFRWRQLLLLLRRLVLFTSLLLLLLFYYYIYYDFFMLSLSAFCSHTHTHLIVYVRAYTAFLLTGI